MTKLQALKYFLRNIWNTQKWVTGFESVIIVKARSQRPRDHCLSMVAAVVIATDSAYSAACDTYQVLLTMCQQCLQEQKHVGTQVLHTVLDIRPECLLVASQALLGVQ